jgi:hypothetical protein
VRHDALHVRPTSPLLCIGFASIHFNPVLIWQDGSFRKERRSVNPAETGTPRREPPLHPPDSHMFDLADSNNSSDGQVIDNLVGKIVMDVL